VQTHRIKQLELEAKTPPLAEEIAFVTGFVEGEGCFHLDVERGGNGKNGFCINAEISIVNTSKKLIAYCHQVLGVGQVYYEDSYARKSVHKPTYQLRITKWSSVLKATRTMLPYLRSKLPQALILEEFCVSRHGKKTTYTPRERKLVQQLHRLNHRGTRPIEPINFEQYAVDKETKHEY